MKILVFDTDRDGLPFCMRCKEAGHDVVLWMPPEPGTNDYSPIGQGLVDRVRDWRGKMKWADLIVLTYNSKYTAAMEEYFVKGFPIIGANAKAAQLELDREVGVALLDSCGVKTIPFETFSDYKVAEAYVRETNKTYVSKPWGGNPDKSLSYVAKSPADLCFKLQKWNKMGLKGGKFMLQQMVKGAEMAVGGWFGPGGWSQWKNENWEEKRLMNEGLGVNTGEMGTVMRYVRESKLFDDTLLPCTDALHRLNYTGYVDMNCIVGEDGTPWPLEFTMRFGWPHFNLCMALHQGDPAEYLLGLLHGQDLLKVKEDICVGVVMAHGDFPYSNFNPIHTIGFPITGLTASRRKNVALSSAMISNAPMMVGGKVKDVPTICTAGDYVAVATGLGETVCEAQAAAYETAWALDWPSNRMFRTDIGCRLEQGLKALQAHGYAKGMTYE